MASFNKVILIGNMTADPELKQTAAGISVCSFSIAVNRRFAKAEQGQQNVDFINIVTWRQQAEFVSRYFQRSMRTRYRSFDPQHRLTVRHPQALPTRPKHTEHLYSALRPVQILKKFLTTVIFPSNLRESVLAREAHNERAI